MVPLALRRVQEPTEGVQPPQRRPPVAELHGGRLLALGEEPRGQLALALHGHLRGLAGGIYKIKLYLYS